MLRAGPDRHALSISGPLLPDRAPGIPTRRAGVNPAAVPGLQRRRGGQAEPSACGPPIIAANPVGGVCGRSSRWRRLREEKVVRPRGRGEPGVPRARRPGRVPPHGGRGAEAAAGQKHIQQQQLEEQQPQRFEPQRLAPGPCGRKGAGERPRGWRSAPRTREGSPEEREPRGRPSWCLTSALTGDNNTHLPSLHLL